MISFIKGKLTEFLEDIIVIEVNGIGYNVRVPASIFSNIPKIGETIKIYTYLQVREDAMNLFGFLKREDLDIFKLLINVNGIGPKGALAILSNISPNDLRFAVLSDDVKLISSTPGIGAKTAQKLIIELKDKLKLTEAFEYALNENSSNQSSAGDVMLAKNEAVEALVSLGYSSSEALKTVNSIDNIEEKNSETILKEALKKLALF